jgi:hypothetical protein
VSGYDVDAHAFDEPRYEDVVERIRAYGWPAFENREELPFVRGEPIDPAYDAREAYELDDPKHPDHYETLVDIWDSRDGK